MSKSKRKLFSSVARLKALGGGGSGFVDLSEDDNRFELSNTRHEKCLDVAQQNSTRHQQMLIEQAIQDISKLPEKIELVVSQKMIEPQFQKTRVVKATKKLNVPKTGKIYHDLLDIETIPPISIKRAAPFEQKSLDPSPVIADYNQPEYSRVKPQTFLLIQKKESVQHPHLIDLAAHVNQNDFLRFERDLFFL